jgi:hypothetical protein
MEKQLEQIRQITGSTASSSKETSKCDTTINSVDSSNNNHNNHCTIVHDNRKTTIINVLGKENMDYLELEQAIKSEDGFVDFIKDVHFNRNHPENHNMKLNGDLAEVFKKHYATGKQAWKKCSRDEALSDAVLNGESKIQDLLKKMNDKAIHKIVVAAVEKEISVNTDRNKYTKKLDQLIPEKFP